MKLKIGDEVKVLAGKNKGKQGKVTKLLSVSNKIVVEKVNFITKHVKKTAQKAGEKITYEAPFNASNAMLVCPQCKKTTRVAHKTLRDGKKQRVCKKCGESVDQIVVSKKTSSKQKK